MEVNPTTPPKLGQSTQNSSDQTPLATTESILNWVEKVIGCYWWSLQRSQTGKCESP